VVDVTVGEDLDEEHVDHSIDAEHNFLTRMLVFETNFESVFRVISRFKLIVLVVLTGLGAKLAHELETQVGQVEQELLERLVQVRLHLREHGF